MDRMNRSLEIIPMAFFGIVIDALTELEFLTLESKNLFEETIFYS